jgi:uncharacterized protein YqeY
MSDITYHEKSQPDPNAAASEDTVIDVLRKSVDKRVRLYSSPVRHHPLIKFLQIQAAKEYPSDHPNRSTLDKEISLISGFLPKTLEPSAISEILSGIVQGLKEDDKKSKAATGTVLSQFWQVVSKGQVADKKVLGKEIAELLKKVQI